MFSSQLFVIFVRPPPVIPPPNVLCKLFLQSRMLMRHQCLANQCLANQCFPVSVLPCLGLAMFILFSHAHSLLVVSMVLHINDMFILSTALLLGHVTVLCLEHTTSLLVFNIQIASQLHSVLGHTHSLAIICPPLPCFRVPTLLFLVLLLNVDYAFVLILWLMNALLWLLRSHADSHSHSVPYQSCVHSSPLSQGADTALVLSKSVLFRSVGGSLRRVQAGKAREAAATDRAQRTNQFAQQAHYGVCQHSVELLQTSEHAEAQTEIVSRRALLKVKLQRHDLTLYQCESDHSFCICEKQVFLLPNKRGICFHHGHMPYP